MGTIATTAGFYRDLPVLQDFATIADVQTYQPVPDDWYVVITDVVGSTRAIEAGRYKQVNIAGGIAAMAISNALDDMEYPFVFGGDGITILVYSDWTDRVRDVLADTQKMVAEMFELHLRVGLVPVGDVRAAGFDIRVARVEISPYYSQAMIEGEGLDWAEEQIKATRAINPYLVPATHKAKHRADFSGFSCRWEDVKSPRGETLALIVKPQSTEVDRARATIQSVLQVIEDHLGDDYHPLREDKLKPTLRANYLNNEIGVTSHRSSSVRRVLTRIRVYAEVSVLKLVLKLGLKTNIRVNGYELDKLPAENVRSADFRKFDNTLKMIVACTPSQREGLVAQFEQMYRAGQVFYGVHVSDRALTTCMMHEGSAREVHFVDAAGGGYALAAKQLKAQLRRARGG